MKTSSFQLKISLKSKNQDGLKLKKEENQYMPASGRQRCQNFLTEPIAATTKMFQQAIRNILGTNENIKSLSKVIESLNKKTGDITKNYNTNCTTEKCDK